ncbi:MAG: two-partner secretion domain-containing protein [Planctomycetota bacterium]
MNLLRTSSQKSIFRSVMVYLLVYCMFFNASVPVLLAGPEGAQVVNGNVTINQSGFNTTITASDKAIINYSGFDISRAEIVQFIQPGTSASVLNRILSANPTNINGTLLANGRVFFVNPAGVYFGNGAQVNVHQLVASALDITDADFINGRYNFAGGEGSVINAGDIYAEKVYLIGKQVANSGSISCPAGYVVMASGDRVFIGEPGSDIVLEIDGPSLPESSDPVEGSGVLNEGTVDAGGGKIVLAAAGDIYSQAISNVGTLSVSDDAGGAGQIKLAAADGVVTNTGTIEASGSEGGQITMEGTKVGQFGTIHADGTDSHGGSVDLTASDVVALSSESLTTANAGLNGNGGEIMIWADGVTRFYGDIEARGGTESGDGGFAEVSGKTLVYRGHTDLGAPVGNAGTLLLDPDTITIAGGTADGDDDEAGDLSTLLEDNAITGQVAEGADPAAFTVYESEIENTDAHIVLEAYDGISTSGDFGGDQLLVMNNRDLTLRTRNDVGDAATGIDLTSSDEGASLEIKTQGTGSITIETGVLGAATPQDAPISLCNLNASGTGSITVNATGAVDIDSAINAGALVSIGGSSINISSNITGVVVTFDADVTADGGGAQTFDAGSGTLTAKSITKAAGDLTLGGATGIDIAGDLSAVGLTIEDDVTASGGGSQEFDAEAGTLTAKSITKAAGDLTLGGATGIDIAGDLSAVGLTIEDDVTTSGGGSQEFDAEGGTLTAKSITKAAGDLTLGGATDIDIAGDLSAVGLTIEDAGV